MTENLTQVLKCKCGVTCTRVTMSSHQAGWRWWWEHHVGRMAPQVVARVEKGDYFDYHSGPLHSLLADEP